MTRKKEIPHLKPDLVTKDIPGFEGLYSVTADGRIWSHAKSMGLSRHGGRWLKPSLVNGYPTVALFSNQKQKMMPLHRAVALAWIPNPNGKPQVNHINGNQSDPRFENLEWCTVTENITHAYANGLRPSIRKLTDPQKLEIRDLSKNGMRGCDLAKRFSVSSATVSRVINLSV